MPAYAASSPKPGGLDKGAMTKSENKAGGEYVELLPKAKDCGEPD